MSDQSLREQERRDQALAYAVESAKAPDPDAILLAAGKFYAFLSNSETQDEVTKGSEPSDEVTKDEVTKDVVPSDEVTEFATKTTGSTPEDEKTFPE